MDQIDQKQKYLIVIAGPTAVGKTNLSIDLANYFNCPIISFDSRQFYKEMSVGTAKPSEEELAAADHYFINSRTSEIIYTSGMYEMDALKKLKEIYKENNLCIAVGGSGLYINALCYGIDDIPSDQGIRNELETILKNQGIERLQQEVKRIDPSYYEEADIKNPRRLMRAIEVYRLTGKAYSSMRQNQPKERPFKTIWIGLSMEIEDLFDRINTRVDEMIENGLLDEVRSLIPIRERKALKTVGYREIFEHLDGKISLEEAIEKIKVNTRRYAKRQITWFKKNSEVNWFDNDAKAEIIAKINEKISS